MAKPITLRGHHIEALAEHYAKQKGLFPKKHERSVSGYLFSGDQYKVSLNTLEIENNLYVDDDIFGFERKRKVIDPIMDDMLSDSELEIKIVFGIDSICKACPSLAEGCKADGDESDKCDSDPLIGYNIDKEKTYTMGELIKIFDDYIHKTGFPSPRTRNGFLDPEKYI